MDKLRVLSLFAGIGSFEKALKQLQVDVELVGYSEIDLHASRSYSAIHSIPETMNLGDINLIDEKKLPPFDLMTYGFPCQTFSIQGNRKGFEDETRGNLFFESMRLTKEKRPSFMIAENVAGLVTHDKGNTLQVVLQTLEDLGYNNYYDILNSVNFGMPHSRERIFIVSIRKDVDQGKFILPKGEMTKLTVADFIDWDVPERRINETLRPFLDPQYHKEYVSNNGLKKVFDGNAQGFFTSDFTGKRLYSVYGTCPTLTANKLNAHNFIEVKGGLLAKEWFRLQGFSDEDYEKASQVCTESFVKKQAGNSITVNTVKAILAQLFEAQKISFSKE